MIKIPFTGTKTRRKKRIARCSFTCQEPWAAQRWPQTSDQSTARCHLWRSSPAFWSVRVFEDFLGRKQLYLSSLPSNKTMFILNMLLQSKIKPQPCRWLLLHSNQPAKTTLQLEDTCCTSQAWRLKLFTQHSKNRVWKGELSGHY